MAVKVARRGVLDGEQHTAPAGPGAAQDGLFTGDRILSLTGTVQEFSGDTQMVFPSWIRKEGYPRPEDRPTLTASAAALA